MNKFTGLLATLATVITASATTAQADSMDRRIYVAPLFAYSMADEGRLTDDGLGAQIAVGKRFASGLDLEVTGFVSSYDGSSGGTLDTKAIGIGALLYPLSSMLPNLFASFSVYHGGSSGAPGAKPEYESTVFDSGLGYRFEITDTGLAIRAEGRYRMDNHNRRTVGAGGDKHFYDGVFLVGLHVPIGHYVQADADTAAVEIVETAAGDADGDAVSDDQDQCPDTPAGTAVGATGCEETAMAEPAPVEEAPAAEPVSAAPAAAAPSSCRQPFPGEQVDASGCATATVIVLSGVTFMSGSATLTSESKTILDQVAENLVATPAINVEVGGHTDSSGSDAANQDLSTRRAEAVKTYLVTRGVGAERMSAKGYGESQAVASNDSAANRALNRRIELKVLDGAPAPETASAEGAATAETAEVTTAEDEAPTE